MPKILSCGMRSWNSGWLFEVVLRSFADLSIYLSLSGDIIKTLKENGNEYTWGSVTVKLAEAYGFCWGVERAVQIAYEARKQFPDDKIWITNDIIHNPTVNKVYLLSLSLRTVLWIRKSYHLFPDELCANEILCCCSIFHVSCYGLAVVVSEFWFGVPGMLEQWKYRDLCSRLWFRMNRIYTFGKSTPVLVKSLSAENIFKEDCFMDF